MIDFITGFSNKGKVIYTLPISKMYSPIVCLNLFPIILSFMKS